MMQRLIELVSISFNLRYIDGIIVMDQTMDTLEAIDRLTCRLFELGHLSILWLIYNDFLAKVLLTGELSVMNFDFFYLLPLFVEHLVIPFTLARNVIWSKEVLA